MAIEVLCKKNRSLEHRTASADELHKTVVHLEAEVEAVHAECEAWCASPSPFFSVFFFHFGTNFVAPPGSRRSESICSRAGAKSKIFEISSAVEEHVAACA